MKRILFFILTLTIFALPGAWLNLVYAADLPEDATLVIHRIASPSPDLRAVKLSKFLESHNSPLAPYADKFVTEADKNHLDWKLVTAISGVESTFGAAIPTYSYNAWGWGVFTGKESGVNFKDWSDGIAQVSEGLKKNYIDKGAQSVEQIGRIYAASPAWSWKVNFFLKQIDNFVASRPELIEVNL